MFYGHVSRQPSSAFMIPVFTFGPLVRLESACVVMRCEAGHCRLFSDGSHVPVIPPSLPWPGAWLLPLDTLVLQSHFAGAAATTVEAPLLPRVK